MRLLPNFCFLIIFSLIELFSAVETIMVPIHEFLVDFSV